MFSTCIVSFERRESPWRTAGASAGASLSAGGSSGTGSAGASLSPMARRRARERAEVEGSDFDPYAGKSMQKAPGESRSRSAQCILWNGRDLKNAQDLQECTRSAIRMHKIYTMHSFALL